MDIVFTINIKLYNVIVCSITQVKYSVHWKIHLDCKMSELVGSALEQL